MNSNMGQMKPLHLGDERKGALNHAAEIVARAWAEFDHARSEEHLPSEALIALLQKPLPNQGMDAITGLDLAAEVLDSSLAQSRPRYLAYIGSSGLEIGALADLLAHSYDINLALDARGATLLNHQTLNWLSQFIGFSFGGGAFTSGGTMSNITALAAARESALLDVRKSGMVQQRPVVYCSKDAHYSVRRGIELLGIGSANLRSVPIDEFRKLSPNHLRAMIKEDLAAGNIPVAVVATGGTTLIGAIDPIEEILEICQEFDIWLHIDGAYGLPAAAVPRLAPLFQGIESADSASVDAHKWLFVPKACSAVLVRDRRKLLDVFSHEEAYMPHDGPEVNAVDYTLEYSQPLRALKLWLAFSVHGADDFRAAITANLDQAQLLFDLASAEPLLETLPFRPELSIVPIRATPAGVKDLNGFNTQLCAEIQSDGRLYLSPATIDEKVWLRPCFTNFRTSNEDVFEAMEVILEISERILG